MGIGALNIMIAQKTASRPYSKDRDGFVIAGGGGFVILESLRNMLRPVVLTF